MCEDEEKSFCYIEGSTIDNNAAEEISDLHENVWYRMKPPKRSVVMYSPFVSARKIELIRNMLLGKTAIKTIDLAKPEPKPEPPKDLRRDVAIKPCLKLRKSSVKFLNEHFIYQ